MQTFHTARFSGSPHFMVGLLLVLALTGCVNSWDGPPHFVHIDAIQLELSPEEGAATERIEEVWVYSETDVLGAFPLPADIPLSPEQLGSSAEITFSAGIRANAISSTRQPYPFYDAVVENLDIDYGGFDTLALTVGYTELTEVIVAEDFETANRFQESVTSSGQVIRTEDPAFVLDGVGSGLIVLDSAITRLSQRRMNKSMTSERMVLCGLNWIIHAPSLFGLDCTSKMPSTLSGFPF